MSIIWATSESSKNTTALNSAFWASTRFARAWQSDFTSAARHRTKVLRKSWQISPACQTAFFRSLIAQKQKTSSASKPSRKPLQWSAWVRRITRSLRSTISQFRFSPKRQVRGQARETARGKESRLIATSASSSGSMNSMETMKALRSSTDRSIYNRLYKKRLAMHTCLT